MKVLGKMSRRIRASVVLPLEEQPERATMSAFVSDILPALIELGGLGANIVANSNRCVQMRAAEMLAWRGSKQRHAH